MSARILAVVFIGMLLAAGAAGAQSVTRGTFHTLEEVRDLLDAERYSEAVTELETLVQRTKRIPYDFALANQYLAHTHILLDEPEQAREALEAALSVEGLPSDLAADLKRAYGTVLLGQEEYSAAVKALDEWLAAVEDPAPPQILTVAYAHYRNGTLPRAEELMEHAFSKIPHAKIEKSWFQVYYRILFEQKKYAEGEALLYEWLSLDPSDEQRWLLLASHYLQLEKSEDALASLMLAHWNDLVIEPENLKRIVSLYGAVDVPEKAARLLEGWLEEGRISTDADALEKLGNLWLLARERDKAKAALTRAADYTADGEIFQQLGSIYFEDEDWTEAYGAYHHALEAGGLAEPPQVSLLAGVSAYRAGMGDEARTQLEAAATSSKYRQQAQSLLRQLDRQ